MTALPVTLMCAVWMCEVAGKPFSLLWEGWSWLYVQHCLLQRWHLPDACYNCWADIFMEVQRSSFFILYSCVWIGLDILFFFFYQKNQNWVSKVIDGILSISLALFTKKTLHYWCSESTPFLCFCLFTVNPTRCDGTHHDIDIHVILKSVFTF